MHELTIVQHFVGTTDQAAAQRGIKQVKRVTLNVGALTGVIPKYVRMYYDEVCEGTRLEGSILDINYLEAEAFCRAMTERFRGSLPEGCEVRLATESEMIAALAEDETAKMCEATGRSADDCVGTSGAVARARFRRTKEACQLERFGKWTEDGRLVGKPAAVAGLPMPRACGPITSMASSRLPMSPPL